MPSCRSGFFLSLLFCLLGPGAALATNELALPGKPGAKCAPWFSRLAASFGLGPARDPLESLRKLVGPEVRPATEFEQERALAGTVQAWAPYKGMEVGHERLGHGQLLLFRTQDGRYFSLDAALPHAQEILGNTVLKQPPPGYASAGGYFSGWSNAHLASSAPPEIRAQVREMKAFWPTPETLNRNLGLGPRSPLRFTRSANTNLLRAGSLYTSDLLRPLAAGELPVPLSKEYEKDLLRAFGIFRLAQTAGWERFQNLLKDALKVIDDPNALAHDKREAAAAAGKSIYELVFGALENPTGARGVPQAEGVQKLQEALGKSRARLDAIRAQRASPSPLPAAAGRPALRAEARGDTLLLEPDDLYLILDDYGFASREKSGDPYYVQWLIHEIARDGGSSGHSLPFERMQMRLWLYRQYPQLTALEPPAELTVEERQRWWTDSARKIMGDRIRVEKVPHEHWNDYQEEAHRRFTSYLNEEFGGTFRSASGGSPSGTAANAYAELGLAPSADLAAVKAAYRKKAMELHPDHNPFDDHAEEKMKALNNAYDLLKRQLGIH